VSHLCSGANALGRTAFIYLRVSSKEQAEKGGEAEGYSIPAQREACMRKAGSLRAPVVEEFVERGESAKTADRPELRRLLAFIREQPIKYVIVHKVDRLARNRADNMAITLAIRQARAELVSVSENIDETPSGLLLHGIMSSIAEFYSRNLATEVIKGSVQKAKNGGTPKQRAIPIAQAEDAIAAYYATVQLSEPEVERLRVFLGDELSKLRGDADRDRTVESRRLRDLEGERNKLLDAYYAEATPVAMLKSEQDRLAAQIASAEGRLGEIAAGFQTAEATCSER
jgi:DNA invertase Pin-like site-specific DNA recombinase